MKFYAEPHLAVYEIQKKHTFGDDSSKKRVLICQFDSNGEFVTTDEKLIAKLIKRFKHDEAVTTIDEKLVETEEVKNTSEAKLRHCKKCDYTCETQGQLLAHYRENHSKEGN